MREKERKREIERTSEDEGEDREARGCPFVPDVNPISTADVKCRTDFGFVCVNSAGAERELEKQKAHRSGSAMPGNPMAP